MADSSHIEWTEATWNPVAGCYMVSPGCTNCYAMRMAARLQAMGQEKYRATTRKSGGRAVWTGEVRLSEETLSIPLEWKSPRKIFVNSMSDLFQEGVPVEFIRRVWDIMKTADWHDFQILTKRPERMANILSCNRFEVLNNVWLGTSIESTDYMGRIIELCNTPAAVRFLSLEPLLGPLPNLDLRKIDWVIVGGESGPGARPLMKEWVEDIQLQCISADVPFFFKQWGGRQKKHAGRLLNGRTWDEYPRVA